MQQQRATLELDEEILSASLCVQDAMAGNSCRKVVLHSPPQTRLMDVQGDDASPYGVRLNATTRGLDFREFRHAPRLRPGAVFGERRWARRRMRLPREPRLT